MSSILKAKSQHQLKVEAFMLRAGQDVPLVPTIPSPETRKLRANLILEEALETIRALGVTVVIDNKIVLTHCSSQRGDIQFHAFDDPADPEWAATGTPFNLEEVVDGCCDIKVVTTGTLSACGVPDEFPQSLVDENNLNKFGPGGHRDPDTGKWIKPPDHQPPAIASFLSAITPLGGWPSYGRQSQNSQGHRSNFDPIRETASGS